MINFVKKNKNKRKKKKEFSKVLLAQESALIWVHSLAHIILAFYCIYKGFTGSLPWLAAEASLPWAAYAVSQAFYYNKATRENTKNGIKYETVMNNLTPQTPTSSDEPDVFGPI